MAKQETFVRETRLSRGPKKSVEQVAAERGVKLTRLEDIWGKGADLWANDLELERFVDDIYALRKEGRERA